MWGSAAGSPTTHSSHPRHVPAPAAAEVVEVVMGRRLGFFHPMQINTGAAAAQYLAVLIGRTTTVSVVSWLMLIVT